MALHFSVSALPTPNPNPNPQPTPAPAPMPEPLLSNKFGGASPSTKTDTKSHEPGFVDSYVKTLKEAPGKNWDEVKLTGSHLKTGAGNAKNGIGHAIKSLGSGLGF